MCEYLQRKQCLSTAIFVAITLILFTVHIVINLLNNSGRLAVVVNTVKSWDSYREVLLLIVNTIYTREDLKESLHYGFPAATITLSQQNASSNGERVSPLPTGGEQPHYMLLVPTTAWTVLDFCWNITVLRVSAKGTLSIV